MVAGQIGMKTYLTTGADEMSIELSRDLAKGSKVALPTPHFTGALRDLSRVVAGLV
jgi:hypothetical protein